MTRGQSAQAPRQSQRANKGQKCQRFDQTEVGQGSNQGGNAPQTFEKHNFRGDAALERYNKKFKGKKKIAGRVVKYPERERVRFPYFPQLREQGWEDYLKLDDEYYPDLIRAFYSNGMNRFVNNRGREYEAKDKFITRVNGVSMEITPELIDTIFNFPTDGLVDGDVNLNFEENLDRAALVYPSRSNPQSVNQFSFHDRLLHTIIASTLRPVRMKYSKFDNEQLYFMKRIKEGRHIRLSSYIVHDMSKIVSGKIKFLYYGRVITRILQHFRVDLSQDESRMEGDGKKPIGDEAFNKIPYLQQDGTWVPNHARVAAIEAVEAAAACKITGSGRATSSSTSACPN